MQPLYHTFRYFLYVLYFYFLKSGYLLGIYTPPKKIESRNEVEHKYLDPIKTRFLRTFEESSPSIDFNVNIEKEFYDKKEFAEVTQYPENNLEKKWKTRILLESTPRGNILMFYDAYKLGFSYYSDQKVISYDILNAAAMKYVTMYRCRDFFIDEHVVPSFTSPLIKLHYLEEVKEKKENPIKSSKNGIYNVLNNTNTIVKKTNEILEKSPFAKLRNYAKADTSKAGSQKESKEVEPEKMQNKFLYLGKMQNYKWLQTVPKKKKVLSKFVSPLMETIIKDSGVQREVMKYSDFKKLKPKIEESDSSDPL